MVVRSQKDKGSEMARAIEFSSRWKSEIIILFVNRYRDRKLPALHIFGKELMN